MLVGRAVGGVVIGGMEKGLLDGLTVGRSVVIVGSSVSLGVDSMVGDNVAPAVGLLVSFSVGS